MSHRWSPGDFLTHRSNPELGVGRVTATDVRTVTVAFPRTGTTLRLAGATDALVPVDLGQGRPVRLMATREETTVAARLPDGRLRLADGREVGPEALWPLELEGALLDRLALGDLDRAGDFVVRLQILRLLALREAGGLGSFLGGRVRLFPHQLHVAEKATRIDPVRWLLADEVGLGKTIEACLILNRLVHTGRVQRCLVVAPEALTVQWLGELWRKYHQVFTILDEPRLADVARDFGSSFNPFDVHRRAVVALETLVARPELTEQAVRAGIDLLVVDEAQRIRRQPGHPGDAAWRAVAPIAAPGRHVLLLSATPLEDDAHGFFRLLQLLRPDDFPEEVSFEARLASGTPLPPCTSSTRRTDIGGLPPRVGIPIDLPDDDASRDRLALERTLRAGATDTPIARRRTLDRVRRGLASGAALHAALGGAVAGVLTPAEAQLRQRAEALDAHDARVTWLLREAPRWHAAREKTLVFVAHRESLEMLRTVLSHRAQLATGVFHEELSSVRRDTEVARFREPGGPSLLVSTECGGEGRNFEFCRRIVLFDLPWRPPVVEQRIGRLDRIGRRIPVEIVYFRPPAGIGRDVVTLFEALGVFREPLAGLEPQLAHVEGALETVATDPDATLTPDRLEGLLADAQAARTRIREAAYQQLHREPYQASMAPAILSRVPDDLDVLNEQVITKACERLGFRVERQRGARTWALELGNEALVDSLPGVPGGTTFVGTFDREEAVARETIDFFASGHPLVEGVFAHFDDAPQGRVARVEVTVGAERGQGLVALYRDGASGFDVVAVDADGRPRPTWAAAFRDRGLLVRRIRDERQGGPGDPGGTAWAAMVRRAGARLDAARRPFALAAVVVRPAPAG